MKPATSREKTHIIPKKRQKHHSYDESIDEPASLLKNEPVEIEAETPAEENQPIENIEQDGDAVSAAFEE
jgi:hypothetical protein